MKTDVFGLTINYKSWDNEYNGWASPSNTEK